jgi:hypothetical protein
MVADGRIPRDCLFYISEKHYRFIPNKIKALTEEGRLMLAEKITKKGSKK